MKKTVVTSALPYANGPIHIGHLAGAYLPADIFTRFKKLLGDDVIYICGTDEHGTPITFQAEKQGVSPKVIVDRYHKEILDSLTQAGIQFDYFSRTTTKVHYELTQEFFKELYDNDYIETQVTEHFYCENPSQFLPDRYIQGECPSCGYDKARGDECPSCGKWLDADKLKNPYSPFCKVDLTKKATKHWYLRLDKLQPQIQDWLRSKPQWKSNVINFIEGWFKEGLKSRAITRDISWGVPVPLEGAENKVLYVWFDAPIGYMSMTKEWAKNVKNDEDLWKAYWQNPESEVVHFIGKDNIPFHAVVWPGMIMGQNTKYSLPTDIPANEHLTINGEKISTSRGNCLWVEDVVKEFSSDYLRFYLAFNAPENKDADFSWQAFGQTINKELINVVGNLHQRTVSFIADYLKNGAVPALDPTRLDESETKTLSLIKESITKAKGAYLRYKVKDALKIIVDLCREGNTLLQEKEPWKTIKENESQVGNLFNILIRLLEASLILLTPVIPVAAKEMLKRLGLDKNSLDAILKDYAEPFDPAGRILVKSDPLFKKIDDKQIQQKELLLEEKIKMMQEQENKDQNPESEIMDTITIEDFSKIKLRTGKILSVENVPKSTKLLKFEIQTEQGVRQILSGISEHYPIIEDLIGKNIVFVENLKPRKVMGLVSEGMILSAENMKTGQLEVVSVSDKVGYGAYVK